MRKYPDKKKPNQFNSTIVQLWLDFMNGLQAFPWLAPQLTMDVQKEILSNLNEDSERGREAREYFERLWNSHFLNVFFAMILQNDGMNNYVKDWKTFNELSCEELSLYLVMVQTMAAKTGLVAVPKSIYADKAGITKSYIRKVKVYLENLEKAGLIEILGTAGGNGKIVLCRVNNYCAWTGKAGRNPNDNNNGNALAEPPTEEDFKNKPKYMQDITEYIVDGRKMLFGTLKPYEETITKKKPSDEPFVGNKIKKASAANTDPGELNKSSTAINYSAEGLNMSSNEIFSQEEKENLPFLSPDKK